MIVDFVVMLSCLEERVGDLREAEPLVALHDQRHDADAVEVHGADLRAISDEFSTLLNVIVQLFE